MIIEFDIFGKIFKIDTQSIISKIKNKDEHGMSYLLKAYGNAIYTIINKIVTNQEDAEEVMQTTFLKIWNQAESFDDSKASLFTWMGHIAKNTAIDKLRSKGVRNSKNTASLSDKEYNLGSLDTNVDFDIKSIARKLPEKYRLLIEKMYIEGYTQQEISDHYDIPLGTVKTRLRESINLLRKELANDLNLMYFLSLML
ncbi:MAG TPA: sigma-70 family RNA polymerase sigma factor [Saprospiraceae bacterium]|nr:sigma-70 family RNA polymerase sigma factor [Saprospiraceae bacterium]